MRRIGEVAAAAGLTVRTLHHYDEIGLLAPAGRTEAAYRLYSDDDVRRLYRIVAFRRVGLAPTEIGALLDRDGAATDLFLEAIEGMSCPCARTARAGARPRGRRPRSGGRARTPAWRPPPRRPQSPPACERVSQVPGDPSSASGDIRTGGAARP
jgi:DNA-binding transcriptional MerR regulator